LREVDGSDRVEGSLDLAVIDTQGNSCEGTYGVVGVRVD
jgi:hypothetical protein